MSEEERNACKEEVERLREELAESIGPRLDLALVLAREGERQRNMAELEQYKEVARAASRVRFEWERIEGMTHPEKGFRLRAAVHRLRDVLAAVPEPTEEEQEHRKEQK